MSLVIRDEAEPDLPAIHAVNARAFHREAEAQLVDELRAHGRLTLSLVALEGSEVVGHIAFSPVSLATADGRYLEGLGLGPMAVRPEHQRGGIGSALVRTGIERLRAAGHPFCVVLGHARYYPRFGFAPASRLGIRWEKQVPDDVFLALELQPGALAGISGVVRYGLEFDAV